MWCTPWENVPVNMCTKVPVRAIVSKIKWEVAVVAMWTGKCRK
jgi:hypothetical protein